MKASDPVAGAAVEALVLAGGLGTRLRSTIGDNQKVLAGVGGRPFIFRILEQLASSSIRRATLCVGFKADAVKDTLGESFRSLELAYSVESAPMGTAGAIRLALGASSSSRILVMNGDSFIDVDLNAFLSWSAGRASSILLTKVEDSSRYGRVSIDASSRILSFEEKGSGNGPGLINAGIYVFDRALLLDRIPQGRPVSMEKEIFPSLLRDGLLHGFVSDSPFIDIGTPESYKDANSGKAPFPLRGQGPGHEGSLNVRRQADPLDLHVRAERRIWS